MSPSPNSFAWYQNCCKAFPKCVLGEIQWHPFEIILRHFQIVSQPKFGWTLLKFFQDVFGLPHSPNSFAWYRRCCKAFPKCVTGKIEAHLIEIFLRHFQIVTQPNFSCILLKLNWEVSDLSPSPTSFAWYQKCCKAFPKFVLGEIQWHPIEIIPRYFQILSQPKLSWNLVIFFEDVFELSSSPNSFAWYQKCCKAFPKCVLGEIQWHTIEIVLRKFQILSQPKIGWILLNFVLRRFRIVS